MLIVVIIGGFGDGSSDSGSGKVSNRDGMMILYQTNWPYEVNFQSYHPR